MGCVRVKNCKRRVCACVRGFTLYFCPSLLFRLSFLLCFSVSCISTDPDDIISCISTDPDHIHVIVVFVFAGAPPHPSTPYFVLGGRRRDPIWHLGDHRQAVGRAALGYRDGHGPAGRRRSDGQERSRHGGLWRVAVAVAAAVAFAFAFVYSLPLMLLLLLLALLLPLWLSLLLSMMRSRNRPDLLAKYF